MFTNIRRMTFVAAFAAVIIALMAVRATAANPSANLDQWKNGVPSDPAQAWVNMSLNSNKNHYAEDDSIPYRAVLTNLVVGHQYQFHMEYDTTQGGKHATDYLTSFDVTEPAVNPCAPLVEGGSPIVCSGPISTLLIPKDPNLIAGSPLSGLRPDLNAAYLELGNSAFEFRMWNGTLLSATAPVLSQGVISGAAYQGNTSTEVSITFQATAATAVLAWGGHVGAGFDWGSGLTAVDISGSPYHMRLGSRLDNQLKDLTIPDSFTLGNQDRSLKIGIKTSKIKVSKSCTPATPTVNPLFHFDITFGLTTPASLDVSCGGSGIRKFHTFSPPNYVITESGVPAGWMFDVFSAPPIVCTSSSLSTSFVLDVPTRSVTFPLDAQVKVTCTFKNRQVAAMPVTKLNNHINECPQNPTDNLAGNATPCPAGTTYFTFNLYLQNGPVSGQTVPAGYAPGWLQTRNFPPDFPPLPAPIGIPFSLCDMGFATGTAGVGVPLLPLGWTANWTVTLFPIGSTTGTQVVLNNVPTAAGLAAVPQPFTAPYDPSLFLTTQPSASCLNFTVPNNTARFEITVDNVPPPPVPGRMTGGGSVFTSAGARVTHGFELHCNKDVLPNRLEVNWGAGRGSNNFHLELLTSSSCSLNGNPYPPAASFNTYVGTGTGRLNGVPGATAQWTFTDFGEPGSNDTATILIKDAGGNTVLSVSGHLNSGNQQAH